MKITENDKITIGRITKYTHRTVGKVRAYIEKCIKEDRTPFAEELALQLGVSGQTLRRWATKENADPKFIEAYALLMTVQKLDIKKKSLLGVYENPIAKLILSAEHEVVERFKKEVSGIDGEPIQVENTLTPDQRQEYAKQITDMFEKIHSK